MNTVYISPELLQSLANLYWARNLVRDILGGSSGIKADKPMECNCLKCISCAKKSTNNKAALRKQYGRVDVIQELAREEQFYIPFETL